MQNAAKSRSRWKELLHGAPAGRFRLTQYFTLTSLLVFAIVTTALFFLERAESDFFEAVQREQTAFFAHAQADLVREQKAAARINLLREHEAGHVTLANVLSNALWQEHFAPLVERSQRVSAEQCGELARDDKKGRKACYADLGQRIQAIPGFKAVDAAVHAHMRRSSVFKVKVYDRRGITVYSSELAQVGEDKADNLGWISAVNGRPASELVHRDRFSAFEGMVENRDLIQSYVPVYVPGGADTVGVFEIYSDVTALLAHADALSERIGEMAAANQSKVEKVAELNTAKMVAASREHFVILAGMLVLLYVSLLMLILNAQRIIDEQQRAREQAALREQAWHREKMAALATMAANASHEIGNPLAVISGLAEDIPRARREGESLDSHARGILEQASRIAEMTRRITSFAMARSDRPEPVDVNQMIQALGDFLSFDARYRDTRIETRLAPDLPACVAIPEHLHEVLMTLVQAQAEASVESAAPGQGCILICSAPRGSEVVISIGCVTGQPCNLAATDARLESARRRIEGMGGKISFTETATEILLPCYPAERVAA